MFRFSSSKLSDKVKAVLDDAFTKADEAFDVAEKAFADMDEEFHHGVSITSNNGHIVITGTVKSVRINDGVVPDEWVKGAAK